MKYLVFSPVATAPAESGSAQRVLNICRSLKRLGHEVHFVFFDHEREAYAQQIQEMQAQWDSFHYIPYHPHRRKRRTGADWRCDDWYQDDIGPIVAKLVSIYQIDCVYCNYIFQSKLLEIIPDNVIRIIDTHDAFGDRRALLEGLGLNPSFYFTTPEDEALMLDRADAVIAIQKQEAEYFRKITSVPVFVVGHFSDREYISPSRADVLRVGYIGSFNHLNVRSIRAFLEAFALHPKDGVEIIVGGSICEHLHDLSYPWLHKRGSVKSLDSFYGKIDIAINPMIGGTGLKIKTVEAMEYGLPVLSTVSGSEGLETQSPLHQIRSPEEVVNAIHDVAADYQAIEELRDSSRRTLEQYRSAQKSSFELLFKNRQSLLSALGCLPTIIRTRQRRGTSVLVVTHALFWQRNYGSHRRIYDLLRSMAKHYDVKVFVMRKLSEDDVREFKDLGLKVELKSASEDHPIVYDSDPEALLGNWELPHTLAEDLNRYIQEVDPEACVLEYLRMAPVVKLLPPFCLRILDTHDIISRRELSRGYFEGKEVKITRELEQKAMSKFDFFIAIQKTEFAVLNNWGFSRRVAYIPVTSRSQSDRSPLRQCAATFGFIGASTAPNMQAAEWLLKYVWPLFQARDLKLRIAGSVCGGLRTQFSNVDLLGFVEEEDEYFRTIDVLINPVPWGGGLKIKTVHALGHGVPVIGSPEALAGCEEAIGQGAVVAKSPLEFILAIEQFATRSALFQRHVMDAVKFAEKEFPSELAMSPLLDIIERASPSWSSRS